MNDPSEYFSRHPGRYAISVAAPVAVGGFAAVRARRAPSAAKRCLFGILAVLMAAELIALIAARPRSID